MQIVYKASIARAAAPMIPAAWVAIGPAAALKGGPVELAEEEGLVEPEPEAVAEAARDEALEARDEAAEAAELAADAAELAAEAAELAAEAAELAGGAELAGAELVPEPAQVGVGMVMSTPADLQRAVRPVWACCWSAQEVLATQSAVLVMRSVLPQWHLKSVKLEQPSVVTTGRRQDWMD